MPGELSADPQARERGLHAAGMSGETKPRLSPEGLWGYAPPQPKGRALVRVCRKFTLPGLGPVLEVKLREEVIALLDVAEPFGIEVADRELVVNAGEP